MRSKPIVALQKDIKEEKNLNLHLVLRSILQRTFMASEGLFFT